MPNPEYPSIFESEEARVIRLQEQLKLVSRECTECKNADLQIKLQALLEELQAELAHYTSDAA